MIVQAQPVASEINAVDFSLHFISLTDTFRIGLGLDFIGCYCAYVSLVCGAI